MGDAVVGAALGILMAIISGVALLFLFRAAERARGVKDTASVFSALLSIPTFWFGGPWLTGSLLHSVDTGRAVPFYTITLAVCFGAIAAGPLLKEIGDLSKRTGAARRRS